MCVFVFYRYFRRLACVDLFLDSRPYGSHTVAADALYTHTPVLTLPGASFASRVPQSLYTAATKQTREHATTAIGDDDGSESSSPLSNKNQVITAKSLEALLVSYDRMGYINTAVNLCHTTPTTPQDNEEEASNGSVLALVRNMIKVAIAPSALLSPSSSHALNQSDESQSKPLFNSRLFAADLEQGLYAMKEVKQMYEDGGAVLFGSNANSVILPHIFFGRMR